MTDPVFVIGSIVNCNGTPMRVKAAGTTRVILERLAGQKIAVQERVAELDEEN